MNPVNKACKFNIDVILLQSHNHSGVSKLCRRFVKPEYSFIHGQKRFFLSMRLRDSEFGNLSFQRYCTIQLK